MSDDFYIGYEPEMPASLAPRVRASAAGLVLLAAAMSLGLAAAQGRFSGGVFEFGHERSFLGRVIERPYPVLMGTDGVRYFLVGPGKRGAGPIADGFDGRMVRVRGSLISRDTNRMLQVSSGGIRAVPGAPIQPSRGLEQGPLETLEGEIVDSKCHLGVMKPGEGPLHRDCAVRCLLGGTPPMLAVRNGGRVRRIPLVASDGGPLTLDPEPWAARPLLVRGRTYTRGDERYFGVERGGLSVQAGSRTGSPTRSGRQDDSGDSPSRLR